MGFIQPVEGLDSKDRFTEEEAILLQDGNVGKLASLLSKVQALDDKINFYLNFHLLACPTISDMPGLTIMVANSLREISLSCMLMVLWRMLIYTGTKTIQCERTLFF